MKSCYFWFSKESISESSFVLFNWKLFVQKLLTFYKVCLPWWYDFNFYEGKIIPLSRSLCQDSNYDNEAANYQLFGPCLKQYLRRLQRKARHIDTQCQCKGVKLCMLNVSHSEGPDLINQLLKINGELLIGYAADFELEKY